MKEQFDKDMDGCGMLQGSDKAGNPITYNFYGGIDIDAIFGGPGGVGK